MWKYVHSNSFFTSLYFSYQYETFVVFRLIIDSFY